MIEDDLWRVSNDPDQMRRLIRLLPIASNERKLRLWACACCRRIWHLVTDPRCHRSVEVAEQVADGLATPVEVERARREAVEAANEAFDRWRGVIEDAGGDLGEGYHPHQGLLQACAAEGAFHQAVRSFREPGAPLPQDGPEEAARDALEAVLFAADPQPLEFFAGGTPASEPARREEMAAQAASLRDIFGNPFQPVSVEPAWFSPTVQALATGVYAERAFDRMPILADAFEEAGCDNTDILNHCRGPGPHVLGCWVVDLLLGKHDQ